MEIHIGLTEEQRQNITKGLSRVLADTYTLYIKTHAFHWNVTGPHFQSLHEMFENQYTELFEAVDEIAERIRALGEFAPGSYTTLLQLTSIQEESGVPDWKSMVKQLVSDNEAVVRTARDVLPTVEKVDDQPSLDLLTRRMQVHEKAAWMLRSLVE